MGSIIEKLMTMDGGIGVLCGVLIIACVKLYSQNRELFSLVNKLHEMRINDIKQFTKQQTESSTKMLNTMNNVAKSLDSLTSSVSSCDRE